MGGGPLWNHAPPAPDRGNREGDKGAGGISERNDRMDTGGREGGQPHAYGGRGAVSEDFLRFIREGAVFGLAGRRFSKYVQPYAVDTEADLTEFIEKYETQESYRGDIYYEMAYHWAASDGTDNYLVNEIWEFEAGINTLYWYRDDGEGHVSEGSDYRI